MSLVIFQQFHQIANDNKIIAIIHDNYFHLQTHVHLLTHTHTYLQTKQSSSSPILAVIAHCPIRCLLFTKGLTIIHSISADKRHRHKHIRVQRRIRIRCCWLPLYIESLNVFSHYCVQFLWQITCHPLFRYLCNDVIEMWKCCCKRKLKLKLIVCVYDWLANICCHFTFAADKCIHFLQVSRNGVMKRDCVVDGE